MGKDHAELTPFVSARVAGLDSSVTVGVTVDAALELAGLNLRAGGARASLEIALAEGGRPGPPASLVPRLDPPTSFAVSLELPAISGGGSLARVGDSYRGSLHANLGVVTVTGLAVLTPKRDPDFILVLAAEFTPPIQLSFGFTLVGVGGLVGVNRGPDQERLAAALSSGALSQILFPPPGQAAAARALAALDDCFPARRGAFVVGPMLKLGWGTPTIVSATVGVLVSDDALTVLGRVMVTLPTEQLDLIHLEVLVVGRVDADGLAIDATLANSRIVAIPIEGDFRLRARGGDNGMFALSAGGFHPDFVPPPGMAGMKRLSTHVSPAPIVDLRLEAYFAVTPNAAQFGARVEVMAGIDGFSLRGHGAFDAILTLAPALRFDAAFTASVRVECAGFDVAGVALSLAVSGPEPWRARGHATVSILGVDADIDLPEIGGDAPPALPPPLARNPAAVLAELLERPEHWCATGAAVPPLVRPAPGSTAVHPLAELAFVQHVVPLATELRRMDGVPLPAPVTLEVHDVTTGQRLVPTRHGDFVPRQLLEVDPALQRASAGYLRCPAGFLLRPHETELTGDPIEQRIGYDDLVVGTRGRTIASAEAAEADPFRSTPRFDPLPPPVLVTLREPAPEDVLAGSVPAWELEG